MKLSPTTIIIIPSVNSTVCNRSQQYEPSVDSAIAHRISSYDSKQVAVYERGRDHIPGGGSADGRKGARGGRLMKRVKSGRYGSGKFEKSATERTLGLFLFRMIGNNSVSII